MALPNELQVGRFNGVLTKLLGIKEQGAPAPLLMPELMPGIILENDRPEWHFLGGSRLVMGRGEVAGVALQFSFIALTNPDPGPLIVLERIIIESVGALARPHNIQIAGGSIGGAASTSVGLVDSRWWSGATTAARLRAVSAIILGANDPVLPTPITLIASLRTVGESLQFPCAIVLAPNSQLLVSSVTAGDPLGVSFIWRERFLEPSEIR